MEKRMDFGSKDRIGNLSEDLICHILSFLPIRESAQTSILSKKWRYLFALRPNLDFKMYSSKKPPYDYQKIAQMLPIFTNFVDRVLSLQGNSTLNKFSLRCVYLDNVQLKPWISNVLERGVSDLDLRAMVECFCLPSSIFISKSLVSLRIDGHFCCIDVEDVHLPKLKTIYFDGVKLGKTADSFYNLISACHVLEELYFSKLNNYGSNLYVSSKTLKRLHLDCVDYSFRNQEKVSFDTPNLVYLLYFDYVAHKYPKVNFGSLVEAHIKLVLTRVLINGFASHDNLVFDASDFFMGLRNVQILNLYAGTLEVLAFCCKAMPVFRRLTHLTIETCVEVGWESLPRLLENCPNLETLVFDDLDHKYRDKCGDVDGCLCRYGEEVRPCLSSSPVKVLKIRFSRHVSEMNIEQIEYFLETMPRLEHLIVSYYSSDYDNVKKLKNLPIYVDYGRINKISNQIKNLHRIASPTCKIQIVDVS